MADLFVWKLTSQQRNSWHVLNYWNALKAKWGFPYFGLLYPKKKEREPLKQRFSEKRHQTLETNAMKDQLSKFGVVSAAEAALGRNCDFRLNILALSMIIRIARPRGY